MSALDAPGQPFRDPAADQALFRALEESFRRTAEHTITRLPWRVNDPEFAAALVDALDELVGAGMRHPAGDRA